GTCFLLKICLKTEGIRSKSPSGGRPFRKSGNVGSLAGISILSSRAVRIVHPAASFCANLANSDFDSSRLAVTPVWSARTLTLPDYGRVVRNTTRIALSSGHTLHLYLVWSSPNTTTLLSRGNSRMRSSIDPSLALLQRYRSMRYGTPSRDSSFDEVVTSKFGC